MGIIKGICISEKRGTKKREIKEANFIENWGIEEDAHAGNWHRQVSLLSFDKIEAFREKGANVSLGDFGENLIVEGFDFRSLPVGTRLHCGEVVLEMTQIGKECHSHCQIYKTMGDCIMPREGVFAKVLYGGKMKVEDEMTMELPSVDEKLTAAVITLSDKGFKGEREDESGPAIVTILKEAGYEIVETMILPDEQKEIERNLIRLADQRQVNLILTTGGTGFSIRDCTPEATMAVATRNAPGIAEAIRYGSMNITKRAMLGRGASVIRNETIIVNLPGSKKAVIESLGFIIDELEHGIRILKGSSSDCARK
ncbi:molybdenum cofactor synthesis domain protein [Clostridium argentinense CDC 2741]|uniref:Molybdenum cofactor synthesis domain protein n=1 Tax=Clostridium argentinense CDC 2741 TaxID=1418104 RepID=A0A0C1UKH2_9CLOT|nr:MOSC domain-containing protein [Clostridium argentinense]ARC86112.1 molybdenum cofactor biosynthesis protein [Clostridium argentinense]KIE47775.1 molybdenum cofactor synthesis domain protein [Clostridium argentinense CDC 2741]NFF40378.1 molybdenum cofactor biosynthesis protein [Clostridium argentinense]NFP50185.1 molybdenum cofactor biosynthesis protein [Clostridium argentinense]NFP72700.1 molybdenum cofactor biosynthesis protein [Clostridium argentinense]